jgi:hypothetical protein
MFKFFCAATGRNRKSAIYIKDDDLENTGNNENQIKENEKNTAACHYFTLKVCSWDFRTRLRHLLHKLPLFLTFTFALYILYIP